MKKLKLYANWSLRILVSVGFLFASLGKLLGKETVILMFQKWGYFDGFYFIVGISELVLAILILIPKTAFYSAIGLFIIMIGAFFTHLIHDPILQLLRPSLFMLFLLLIVYLEREKYKD